MQRIDFIDVQKLTSMSVFARGSVCGGSGSAERTDNNKRLPELMRELRIDLRQCFLAEPDLRPFYVQLTIIVFVLLCGICVLWACVRRTYASSTDHWFAESGVGSLTIGNVVVTNRVQKSRAKSAAFHVLLDSVDLSVNVYDITASFWE